MDDRTHAIRARYIRDLGDQMLLRDWVLILSRVPAPDTDNATVRLHSAKNEAEIKLANDWEMRSREAQRQTLVHELLHCHTARLCRVMSRLKEIDSHDLARYIVKTFDAEEEIAIDTMARVLAPHLPLPEAD